MSGDRAGDQDLCGAGETLPAGGHDWSLGVERAYGPIRRRIMDGLREFTRQTIGAVEVEPLTVVLRRGDVVLGGLVGETRMGWLFIEALWVASAQRGLGHGRRIVQLAEQEARRRGAQGVYLNTFSFQAPDFYTKLGYRQCGRLDNLPAGHFRLYLAKSL